MDIKYNRTLNHYSIVMLIATSFLLYAGGFTTTIDAGMAFLDWPLSNGSINPEGFLVERDQTAEHGHRLLGMILGLLSITLVGFLMKAEKRLWVRRIGYALLIVVVLQGVLGGLRVKLDTLNIQSQSNWIAQTFAVLHACGAQVVLCLVASVFVATSRRWVEFVPVLSDGNRSRNIIKIGIILTACIFFQILVGAIMRHLNAGLVISSFPYSTPNGDWLPLAWTFHIFINFSHRIGAIIVCLTLIFFIIRLFKSKEHLRYLSMWLYIPIVLICIQVYLGARITLRMLSEEHIVTTHALIGAFMLCSCWILTMFCFRINNVTLSSKVLE